MFNEHDCVTLTADFEEKGLKSGDGGTIVHIYPGGEVFVVEFVSSDGYSADIVEVPKSQIRQMAGDDRSHARERVDSAV